MIQLSGGAQFNRVAFLFVIKGINWCKHKKHWRFIQSRNLLSTSLNHSRFRLVSIGQKISNATSLTPSTYSTKKNSTTKIKIPLLYGFCCPLSMLRTLYQHFLNSYIEYTYHYQKRKKKIKISKAAENWKFLIQVNFAQIRTDLLTRELKVSLPDYQKNIGSVSRRSYWNS